MLEMVWHAYHAGSLCQLVDFEARAIEIEEIKPEHELPTRRRLMKRVKGQLPASFIKASKTMAVAWEVWEVWQAQETRESCEATEEARAAWEAWEVAWHETGEAYAAHKIEIEQLHVKECPNCSWNGDSIF